MSYALISPPILKWARSRSHLDMDVVAKKVPVKVEKLAEWESGEAMPTFKQAQILAAVLHVPFGYLFLNDPPTESIPIPDLRTVSDGYYRDFSVDLRDVISIVTTKQDWYREYRISQEFSELSFVGKYNDNTEAEVIIQDIVSTLGLTLNDRQKTKNCEEFYKLLVERSESAGLWIMRSSVVGNNTHRKLDVNEFRGFAICDKIAPAIFINGSDAKAAHIFTMVHEIAHLWLGTSGVSNIDFRKDSAALYNQREKKCNEIAAEVLVPAFAMHERWSKGTSIGENADELSKYFKVSSLVIARRALDLDLIKKETFFEYYQLLLERWAMHKDKMKERDGGPSYYKSIPIANGYRFSREVLSSVYSHRLLVRDGARLLGLNPTTLGNYAKEVGIR